MASSTKLSESGYERAYFSAPQLSRVMTLLLMFKKIFRWLDKGFTWWFYLTGFVSVAAMSGFFSKMLAMSTPWIKAMGPYGIWFFTLIGVAFVLLLIMLCVVVWNMLISAKVRNKWKQRVDSVNPLDIEFHKKRIKITDIANPSTSVVQNKVFTDCDIIGPAVIYLWSRNNFTNYAFYKSDFIVMNPNRTINNAIVFDTVIATNCRFYECTVYIDGQFFQDSFKTTTGINFVSLTGDADFDTPQPLKLEE
ncbi:MAG TPA: hypothetical protein VLZ84_04035 [Asticcacaulis sp.]|nr:hypothetical protein [Asticcacaulis sp.]